MYKICRQGDSHYADGLNNQDFCYMEKNLKMITDGCSAGKYSEVGTRLFAQIFSRLNSRLDVNKFESNVEKAFSKICSLSSGSPEEKAEFIKENMLFTIIACFELEDKFVVKFIGDGYLITINKNDMVSYTRLFYGKLPPYYAYNKISTKTYKEKLKFKTLVFPKEDFKLVGIASDGLAPIAEKKIDENFDALILGTETKYTLEGVIRSHQNKFFDDVTILI